MKQTAMYDSAIYLRRYTYRVCTEKPTETIIHMYHLVSNEVRSVLRQNI